MKKLMMAAAIVCAAAAAQAAVDWQYTGNKQQVGYTLYVFSSAVAGKYSSFTALTSGAIGSSQVAKVKLTYVTSVITQSEKLETLYFALIKDSSATEYSYGSLSTKGYVYNPDTQQSPGTLAIVADNLTGPGFISSVTEPTTTPEPTSGLLMLVGGMLLGLRRKRV